MTPDSFVPDAERWNRNIHYHPVLTGLTPSGTVLDVGCGGGLLTRQFALIADSVVGIDPDVASIDLARSETTAAHVAYVLGDALTHPFEPESFDIVASVATIHHMDAAAMLRRCAELTRPGGHVGVVGIGKMEMPRDLPRAALSSAATWYYRVIKGRTLWDHSAPIVWPPPTTEREIRALSATVLPGSTFRRHLQDRYSIVWRKPEA